MEELCSYVDGVPNRQLSITGREDVKGLIVDCPHDYLAKHGYAEFLTNSALICHRLVNEVRELQNKLDTLRQSQESSSP